MMEGGGASGKALLERPWLPVSISGCRLLAKSWFGGEEYRLLLTDLQCVWEERMESAAIQSRAQELNKRLRAPVEAFFSHLREVVQPFLTGNGGLGDGRDAQMSLTRQEDGNINMRVKSELAGLPFYWEFHCTPAPVSVVCVQLVRPLLLMSQLLQRQVEELGGLLVRKDAEIQDYRENGATLSRERLQTEVFVEQTYREDFITKALPQVCSEDSLRFDGDLQQLYTAVLTHGKTRKRKVSETRSADEDRAVHLPPSLGDGDAGGEDGEQSRNRQEDTAGAKMVDRPAEQQQQSRPRPTGANPTERPSSSRPKKKKAVGLFR